MTKLAILLVLGFSSLAPAATFDIRSANAKNMVQDKDRGGGNAVNGQLFDFYENEGTKELNVTEHPVYKKVIAPLLARLEERLPTVTAYLTESLKSKQWYLEPKEISEKDCVNSSMIKAEKKILACQSEFEVRIDTHWFSEMLKKNQQQAAALIVHELLVAKMLENPESISEESVRYLNRLFFSANLPSAADLKKTFEVRGFERFNTAEELNSVKDLISKDIASICPSANEVVEFVKWAEVVDTQFHRAMDGRFSIEQRSTFGKYGTTFRRLLMASYDGGSASPVACKDIRVAAKMK